MAPGHQDMSTMEMQMKHSDSFLEEIILLQVIIIKTGLLFLKQIILIQISRDNLVQSSHKFTVFIIILWRFEESKL